MQLNTMEKLYETMKEKKNEIILDQSLMKAAKGSLVKMLEIS